jgi:PPOX class probable F420-dependent enzyme
MNNEQLSAFLAEPRIASLISVYGDGSPTAVPVWFEWSGGKALIFTSAGSEKVARIQANSHVALSVAEGVGAQEAWVTIEGNATIETTGGFDLAKRLLPRYYSAEREAKALPEWEKMADQWIVIFIDPTRVRSSAPEA